MRRRFKIGKLVRDKMQEFLASKNVEGVSTTLQGSALEQALKQKLVEEANEVQAALTLDDLKEELADVLEVINALCHFHGLTRDEIVEIQENKRISRGSFSKGMYCTYVEMDKNNPHISYYEARTHEYPEEPINSF
jgi:predicted house-cleaning noncanonical NTP pyrophosphatase (MazG superfamily)